ncbi:MAG: flagellar biosynthesis protein FlhF [Bdellovibrionaceae bacterium]|nr:flagellar biosynthesis protein FlhF [Pseudobdellovibrionaceae bacterium]
MQVRKYEASTIKEAVDMIKKDLGPDAIILSTKESQGHPHNKKVLITAAVSEETYQKKRIVEETLSRQEKEKFFERSAREQRLMINHAYTNLSNKMEAKRRTFTEKNYASIPDDVIDENHGRTRVKAAAQAAAMAKKFIEPEQAPRVKAKPSAEVMQKTTATLVNNKDSGKIEELRGEIKRLQSMVQSINAGMQQPTTSGPSYPGARHGVPQELSSYYEKLVGEGFLEKTVADLLKDAAAQLKENVRKKGLMDAWIAKWIYSNTDIVKEKLREKFHVFVGPRGVGKTSSLVKMASHLVIKERKRIAILSTDTNKVGATEQLRIYSQILNVPFMVWSKGQNINELLAALNGVDFVLIDTEGQTLAQLSEIEYLKKIIPQGIAGVRVHLVLSALMKDDELYSVGRRFRAVHYHDILLTNLDQLRRHGVVVNLQSQLKTPYFAFAIGPMIPEDFEWASKERILDLIFKISNSKWEGVAND